MAHHVARMTSTRDRLHVFDYMSDLRNFAEWDPSVERVVQVDGVGGGATSTFDVTVRMGSRSTTLRYRTTTFSPPERFTVIASNLLLESEDRIVVESHGDQTIVIYDAEVRLRGPLRLADGFVQKRFDELADRAAAGLCAVLDGYLVEP